MARYTVLHQGVPIGAVELAEGRQWSGGRLDVTAAYEAVAEVPRAAARLAGRAVVGELLHLPAGAAPRLMSLAADAAQAVRDLAGLTFELRDERNRPVESDVIRIADFGGGRRGVRRGAFPYRRGIGALVAPAAA